MNQSPFLSIGIPTYKRPHRLKNILTILLQQKNINNGEWEIIISDNCSDDETPDIVNQFQHLLPIRYFKNEINIGPDNNFRSLADKAIGKYLWFVPDDDDLVDEISVSTVIEKMKKSSIEISATILNYKLVELDTKKVLNQNAFGLTEDLFINDGKKILDHIADVHLLTGICLVLKRENIQDEFVEKYRFEGNLSPIAMSIAACAKGAVLVIGKPLVILGAGDSANWRKYWSSIYFQSIPLLLIHAQKTYNLSLNSIQFCIEKRKNEMKKSLVWHQFLFQTYDMRWNKMAEIYGLSYVIVALLKSILMIFFQSKLGQKILKI